MSIYTPFTYIITFIPTGQKYYGVRTKRGCHPSELWFSYFTSSKIIQRLIEQHGLDAFIFEIRKTFDNAESAIIWEHRVLTRLDAANNTGYLNQNNGNRKFLPKLQHDEETKSKIGAKHKGKTMTNEAKDKMFQTRAERFGNTPPWLSAESNLKRSQTQKGRPAWNKGKTTSLRGRAWFNDGIRNYRSLQCPPGCVKGFRSDLKAIKKGSTSGKGTPHIRKRPGVYYGPTD